MINKNHVTVGDRVRVKSTGQEVTIDQISQHGFSIIRFQSGGKHRFLNHKLEALSGSRVALN